MNDQAYNINLNCVPFNYRPAPTNIIEISCNINGIKTNSRISICGSNCFITYNEAYQIVKLYFLDICAIGQSSLISSHGR